MTARLAWERVTSGKVNSLAFSSANTAGNLIVAYVLWNNTGSVSLSDSRGNGYAGAVARTTWGTSSSWSAQVFYAKNVAGGSNTVTATFATAVSSFGIIYIHEYAGIDKVNPLDVSKVAVGTASAMSSGSVTTTNANDLLLGAGASKVSVTQGSPGYTVRSGAFGNLTEDRNVTSTGSYAATATQNSNAWVMQLVAFRADPGETSPPAVSITAPANNAQVSDIVMVTADASDNVGVDGVATGLEDTIAPYGLSWDTRTFANGAHTLTARARDAAGNTALSAPVTVNVANVSRFQNEILATGFDLPTNIEFLPDGRMLVVELQGEDQGAAPALHPAGPDAVPADHQHRVRRRAAGHLRRRPGPGVRHQPLLLRLLHRGLTQPGPAVAVHRQRHQHRHRRRQRAGALPGPAGRRRRAPRRRPELRQRRQAVLHHRRALHRRELAASYEPAWQDPPDQPRRHRPQRQPVLRRGGPERRLDLGARAAQPLPRLLRRADRQVLRR